MSKISLNDINNYYDDEEYGPKSSSNKKRKVVKGNIKIEKKNKPKSD